MDIGPKTIDEVFPDDTNEDNTNKITSIDEFLSYNKQFKVTTELEEGYKELPNPLGGHERAQFHINGDVIIGTPMYKSGEEHITGNNDFLPIRTINVLDFDHNVIKEASEENIRNNKILVIKEGDIVTIYIKSDNMNFIDKVPNDVKTAIKDLKIH